MEPGIICATKLGRLNRRGSERGCRDEALTLKLYEALDSVTNLSGLGAGLSGDGV
jgi:hypothetical protein